MRTRAVGANGINWVNMLIGVWLIYSPFVLNYAGVPAAVWNNLSVGIVVILATAYVLFSPGHHEALGWAVAAVGVWEIVAPFILSFSNELALVSNNSVVGVAIIVVGALVARSAWRRAAGQ